MKLIFMDDKISFGTEVLHGTLLSSAHFRLSNLSHDFSSFRNERLVRGTHECCLRFQKIDWQVKFCYGRRQLLSLDAVYWHPDRGPVQWWWRLCFVDHQMSEDCNELTMVMLHVKILI